MATDRPIIAYDNLLNALGDGTGTHPTTTGSDTTSAPFSNCANRNLTSPALPKTDALGDLVVELHLPTAVEAECFIMGGHRHDATGFKSTGGTFTLEYWNGSAWVALLSAETITAENTSTIYKLAAHTLVVSGGYYKYRLSYAGLTGLATVKIPELFLGTYIEMPFLNLGYDEYNEVPHGSKFEAASGRRYDTLYFRRLELNPRWSRLNRAVYDTQINALREDALELLRAIWWAWLPDTTPNACYLMKNDSKGVRFPILSAVHRSLNLKLVEDI